MDTSIDMIAPDDYGALLGEYLRTRSEQALYRASSLSQVCITCGLGPEDLIALHCESIDSLLGELPPREQVRAATDAHHFLLEVMITYGIRYKEYLELRLAETLRDAEMRAARDHERALDFERLDREKGELLEIIAHEMRNPISAARGSIDLVSRALSRGEIAPVPGYLGIALEALERLSRLSADLVEASRGDMPQFPMSVVDLRAIVSQACAWARPVAESKGLELHLESTDDPLQVRGHSDALLSVFGNLLSNAVRYTPAVGRVTIRLGAADGTVWVSVEDTGIGIPPEVRARIFEKFYRSPAARSVEAKGLGLGLALVQSMVDAHGGRIEVESTPGVGATFRVFIAAYDPETTGEG